MNENLKRMFNSIDRESRKRIALEQSWKFNYSRHTIPEQSFKTIALLANCSVEEVKEYFEFDLNGVENSDDFLIEGSRESSSTHLQRKPCYISPYDRFDACISCLPSSEEQCRFQKFRVFEQFFPDNFCPKVRFSSNNKPLPNFTYNDIISSDENDQYILETIAPAFQNILLKEHYHLKTLKNVIIRRILESDLRHLCDHCVTTIFSGYWMCSFCGTEICLDCYDEWNDLSRSRCKKGRVHKKDKYFPITRLTLHDVQNLLDSVSNVISNKNDKINENWSRSFTLQTKWIDGEMNIDQFQYMWRLGIPFMISGFYEKLTHRLWTPKYFSNQFGEAICSCIDVVTKTSRKLKVGDFFAGFSYSSQNEKSYSPCLKIKDWPPNEDFAKAFPLHFNDFMFALPFKKYTHRNGAFNLASRLPPKTNPPDLGPKMYNAYGSTDEVGGKGTTNLHLDMTDAVNIMTYATPFEQRSKYEQQFSHAAVWDIYKMDDLPSLCKFLRKVAREQEIIIDHPIHDQCFYLDKSLRKRLLKEYGIRGVRIYQNPGDVVFVPAGCAHQVCNYTSCIKVALDFVSPEGVERSYKITRQFRTLMSDHKRKEDILQLSNVLFHTWITITYKTDLQNSKGFFDKIKNWFS